MDEPLKQRVMMSVLAFNVTAMGYQLFFNMGAAFTGLKLLLAVGLGLVAAGLAYLITMKTQG
jgi:hypothetical protein